MILPEIKAIETTDGIYLSAQDVITILDKVYKLYPDNGSLAARSAIRSAHNEYIKWNKNTHLNE